MQRLEGRVEEREGLLEANPELWATGRVWRRVAIPLGGCLTHISANRSVQAAGCEGLPGTQTILTEQHSTRVLRRGFWRLHLCWLCSLLTEDERLKTSGYCWVVAISTWRHVAAWEQHAFVLFCFFFSSGGSFINSLWLFLSSWQRCE